MPEALDLTSTLVMGWILPVATTLRATSPAPLWTGGWDRRRHPGQAHQRHAGQKQNNQNPGTDPDPEPPAPPACSHKILPIRERA